VSSLNVPPQLKQFTDVATTTVLLKLLAVLIVMIFAVKFSSKLASQFSLVLLTNLFKRGSTMITRKFLKTLNFRPFDQFDFEGFAGVESPVPFIAESGDLLVILDGDVCEVYNLETLEIITRCDSVSNLRHTI